MENFCANFFLTKMAIHDLFFTILSLQQLIRIRVHYKFCRLLVLNRGPLVLEATTLQLSHRNHCSFARTF